MIIANNKPNKDLRIMIQESKVPQYEIARLCGIAETTLCRWLRYELSPEKRQMILIAIEKGAADHE